MVNSDPKKAIWMAYSIKDDGTIEHDRVFCYATNWGKQEDTATRWPEGESGRESLCHRSRRCVNGRCARILTASRARKLPLTRLLARKYFEGLDDLV